MVDQTSLSVQFRTQITESKPQSQNSEFQNNVSVQTKDQHHMLVNLEHYGNMEIKAWGRT